MMKQSYSGVKKKLTCRLLLLFCTVVAVFIGFTGSRQTALAASARTVTAGKSMSGAPTLAFDQPYTASLSGDETVYLKFKTGVRKGYVYLTGKNLSISTGDHSIYDEVAFEIIDAGGNVQSSFGVAKNAEDTVNVALKPGTYYYIRVHNNVGKNHPGQGNFKVTLSFANDCQGDTKETATQISVGTRVYGSLDGSGDVDYFWFRTGGSSTTKYILTVNNINVPVQSFLYQNLFHVYVYNAVDEALAHVTSESSIVFHSQAFTLQPNTRYYVKVYVQTNGTGNYYFSIADEGSSSTLPITDTGKNPISLLPETSSDVSKTSGSTATSGTGTSSSKGTSSAPAKGTEWKTAAAVYVVTKKGSEVSYKKPAGKRKTVTIPATVKWNGITYKVTGIEKSAFSRNTTVTKITVGKNVRTIGKYAFFRTKNLKSLVILTKNLTASRIGKSAFTQAGAANYKKLTVKVPASKKKAYTALFRKKGLSKKAAVK